LDNVDLNGNGKRDLGEPIPTRFHKPFVDLNGIGIYEPGDSFSDFGLDGVSGTGDLGEGERAIRFTYPNRNNYLANDPLTAAENLPLDILQG